MAVGDVLQAVEGGDGASVVRKQKALPPAPTSATDPFTATSSQTDFVLAHAPVAGSVRPFIDGVRNGNWTLTTATVTFAVGVTEGAQVLIDYLY